MFWNSQIYQKNNKKSKWSSWSLGDIYIGNFEKLGFEKAKSIKAKGVTIGADRKFGENKFLFNQIQKNIENFRPDLILLGHVDRLEYETFLNLKEKYNSIKFAQWFLDPLIENGPDFDKNKNRFFLK